MVLRTGAGMIADIPFIAAVAVAFTVAQVAVVATSIYLHRGLAHRSLKFHPVAEIVFRSILWVTTGQSRQQWVAVHRKHHAFTDRAGDPHSPRVLGFWKVQLFNVYYYVVACRDQGVLTKYAPDLPPDRLDRTLFSRGILGLGVGVSALCLVLGLPAGLLAGGMHAVLYVMVLAPLINAVGHWKGGQNFDNTARNSTVLAWFTGGESLHNNHHAHPRAPKFSMRPREFDPSWPVVRALSTVGALAVAGTPVRLPRLPSRPSPAAATLDQRPSIRVRVTASTEAAGS